MRQKSKTTAIIPNERIIKRILFLRGKKVILDSDLAELYGVETKALNQAVRWNRERFPEDFMFQLTGQETEILRSQFAISSENDREAMRSQFVTASRRNIRYTPFAFTEQGVAMLFQACSKASGPSRSTSISCGYLRN